MWSATICLTFLFYCTCNGQIHLVSLKDQLANMTNKKLLNGIVDGAIKPLKATLPFQKFVMPSQWTQDSEQSYNWADGKVRYYVDESSYGSGVKDVIRMAFFFLDTYATENSCPYFSQLTEKPTDGGAGGDWLHFTNPMRVRQCVHEPGVRRNGEIEVVIGYDCLNPRDVLHTVLHGLGFRDEVSHPKRDLYVRIMWENIQPAFKSLFRVQSMSGSNNLADYDPMSIMHFHDRAFSVNGRATIMSVLPGLKVEQSDKLTHLDMIKVRKIFGHECKKRMIGEVLYTSCGQNLKYDGNEQGPNYNNNAGCPGYNNGAVNPDGIVIPGNDVKLEGEVPYHAQNINNKLSKTPAINPQYIASDEAIIVGYDAEGGGGGAKKLSLLNNSPKKMDPGALSPESSNEAIVAGYDSQKRK